MSIIWQFDKFYDDIKREGLCTVKVLNIVQLNHILHVWIYLVRTILYSLLFSTSAIVLFLRCRLDANIIVITPVNMRRQINLTQSDTYLH